MDPVTAFKTCAWRGEASTERYHTSTLRAGALFDLIRRDLYVAYLQRYVRPRQKILDLGCGTGLLSTTLCDLGFEVIGCDVSEAMLLRFKQFMGERTIELRLGDASNIPAVDGEFDAVVSRMFMQHFPNWRAFLAEKRRVVRPGGFIFYDFGNSEHLEGVPVPADFPYSTDTREKERFYATCSEADLRKVSDELGLELLAVIPCGLLLNNLHYWNAVKAPGIEQFEEGLAKHLESSEVRRFLVFLEENFVAKMAKSIAYGNFTVFRKLTGTS